MSLLKYSKKVLLTGFSHLPSGFKISLYRLLGARIGKNVGLGFGSYILPFSGEFRRIHIGDDVEIEDGVRILAGNLTIGAGSQIKNDTRIWGQSDFSLGTDGYIDQECHFDLRRDITIGNKVTIGGGCWMYTHMVFSSVLSGAPFTFGPVTIRDRSYLGANVFVLPGVQIGNDTIVGARAVVTKDIGPDVVVVGNPAKEINRTSQKTKNLGEEEKQILVKEILDQFLKIYESRSKLLKEWDKTEYVISYAGQPVYYRIRVDDVASLVNFAQSSDKPYTLISFGIPQEVRDYCRSRSICWFDLDDSTRSGKNHGPSQIVEQFLEDYGIRLTRAQAER
jgi:acetyltransferase-like isoleucine patch superfamily enzyme